MLNDDWRLLVNHRRLLNNEGLWPDGLIHNEAANGGWHCPTPATTHVSARVMTMVSLVPMQVSVPIPMMLRHGSRSTER